MYKPFKTRETLAGLTSSDFYASPLAKLSVTVSFHFFPVLPARETSPASGTELLSQRVLHEPYYLRQYFQTKGDLLFVFRFFSLPLLLLLSTLLMLSLVPTD